MEILRHIVVFVHITGFALLFGGWAVEAFSRRFQINSVMNWGLILAAVAGLALAAPWGISYDLNYVKLGVKLVILLAIGALMGIGASRARKAGSSVAPGLFWAIGILTLLNAALAVIWR
ncbi:Fe-S protein [Microbacterium sp.]|uniref:Fe-S protein n=1 Tax=Microbacterium sp. TaxID=51671 RepID=UPI003F70857F